MSETESRGPTSDGPVIIYTTVAEESAAEGMVAELVEQRLIACGTLLPGARSIYRWEGGVIRDQEILIMMKSWHDRIDEITRFIQTYHPYDVPELLIVDVLHAGEAYAHWLHESTR